MEENNPYSEKEIKKANSLMWILVVLILILISAGLYAGYNYIDGKNLGLEDDIFPTIGPIVPIIFIILIGFLSSKKKKKKEESVINKLENLDPLGIKKRINTIIKIIVAIWVGGFILMGLAMFIFAAK